VSRGNPILYMLNAFRYGFLGISDVSVPIAFAIMIGLAAILFGTAMTLMYRGVGMRE
jgi:ABC-2 type transport system permease protein